ncbi:hypothetical protein JTE90_004501 [Oedothorax gibbosus]|uniref:Uncharacterized protein n=1 Tax=Oedothorax gibbosus TaxID=931172 RepID=A0AAV6U3Q8_9ARAC|nr:hypothetical protein JTE90_004501 [Oedothorax gibbosus]
MLGNKLLVLASACAICVIAVPSHGNPTTDSVQRQLATSPPLLPTTIGGGLGGLTNLLPAIFPIILMLGAGAFILPAIGLLLFGGSGGFGGFGGGLFDGYNKKRANGDESAHPLFNTEKLIELVHTFTKALEDASKEKSS